jgi:hypothetical protein
MPRGSDLFEETPSSIATTICEEQDSFVLSGQRKI